MFLTLDSMLYRGNNERDNGRRQHGSAVCEPFRLSRRGTQGSRSSCSFSCPCFFFLFSWWACGVEHLFWGRFVTILIVRGAHRTGPRVRLGTVARACVSHSFKRLLMFCLRPSVCAEQREVALPSSCAHSGVCW